MGPIGDFFDDIFSPIFDVIDFIMDNTIGQIPIVGDFLADILPTVGISLINPYAGATYAGLRAAHEGGPLSGLLAGGTTLLGSKVASELMPSTFGGGTSAFEQTLSSSMVPVGAGSIDDLVNSAVTSATSSTLSSSFAPAVSGSLTGSFFDKVGDFMGNIAQDVVNLPSNLLTSIENNPYDYLKLAGLGYTTMSGLETTEEMRKKMEDAINAAMEKVAPYTEAGASAVKKLSDELTRGFDPNRFLNDPSYAFRSKEGQQAILNRLAASGLGKSGAAAKAAGQFASDLASQEYQNAYQRWLQTLYPTQSLASLGRGAAETAGSLLTSKGTTDAIAAAKEQNIIDDLITNLIYGARPKDFKKQKKAFA